MGRGLRARFGERTWWALRDSGKLPIDGTQDGPGTRPTEADEPASRTRPTTAGSGAGGGDAVDVGVSGASALPYAAGADADAGWAPKFQSNMATNTEQNHIDTADIRKHFECNGLIRRLSVKAIFSRQVIKSY